MFYISSSRFIVLRPINVPGYQYHLHNGAHSACGLKGSTHLSPFNAYAFLSRCRYSTSTPRQAIMVELYSRRPHAFRYGNQRKLKRGKKRAGALAIDILRAQETQWSGVYGWRLPSWWFVRVLVICLPFVDRALAPSVTMPLVPLKECILPGYRSSLCWLSF